MLKKRLDEWELEFLEKGRQEGRDVGRQEGFNEGLRGAVLDALNKKFGTLTEVQHRRIDQATPEQLDEYLTRLCLPILSMKCLEVQVMSCESGIRSECSTVAVTTS